MFSEPLRAHCSTIFHRCIAVPPPPAAKIASATADSPTTAIVGIEPPTTGPLPTSYTVTLTPVGGSPPITVTSRAPVVDFFGLAPAITYTVTAVAKMPNGSMVPVKGSPKVSTPAGPTSPALSTATPTGPTTGSVTIEPPTSGPQPTSYTVTLTPTGGGSPVVVTCADPDDCPVTGLTPDTTYTVKAVGNLPGSGTTPASGTASIITPDDGSDSPTASPTITQSKANSPTDGTIVIAPPAVGPLPANYTVTLTPVAGGSPVIVTCSTPSNCPAPGLTPDTTYLVRALPRDSHARRARGEATERGRLPSPAATEACPLLLQVTATGNFPDGRRTPTPEAGLVTPALGAPEILSATADTPTTAVVGLQPPIAGPLPVSYAVTLTPVGGGSPITVTTTSLTADFGGLTPNTTYIATATATMPDGSVKPVIGARTVSTPGSYNVPALTTTTPTGPTTGKVTIDPPNTPVQPTSYAVTLVPVGGGSPITVTCANPDDCPVPGLAPDTTYTVTAVGNQPGGGVTPASGTASLTTPPTSGPAPIKITAAAATSPYAGTVTIAPPAGTQPTNYTVTLMPVDGGASITVTCTTPASCPVTGLDPGTTYLVSAAGAGLWRGRRALLRLRPHSRLPAALAHGPPPTRAGLCHRQPARRHAHQHRRVQPGDARRPRDHERHGRHSHHRHRGHRAPHVRSPAHQLHRDADPRRRRVPHRRDVPHPRGGLLGAGAEHHIHCDGRGHAARRRGHLGGGLPHGVHARGAHLPGPLHRHPHRPNHWLRHDQATHQRAAAHQLHRDADSRGRRLAGCGDLRRP